MARRLARGRTPMRGLALRLFRWRPRPRAAGLVLLLHLTLVVTAVWAALPGVFTPDTLPGLYTAPRRLLAADLAPWVPDPFLGLPNLQTGMAPVSGLLAV